MGLFVFEDEMRQEAKPVVQKLAELGLHTVIVSGDNRAATEHVAPSIGVGKVFAETLPMEIGGDRENSAVQGPQGGLRG